MALLDDLAERWFEVKEVMDDSYDNDQLNLPDYSTEQIKNVLLNAFYFYVYYSGKQDMPGYDDSRGVMLRYFDLVDITSPHKYHINDILDPKATMWRYAVHNILVKMGIIELDPSFSEDEYAQKLENIKNRLPNFNIKFRNGGYERLTKMISDLENNAERNDDVKMFLEDMIDYRSVIPGAMDNCMKVPSNPKNFISKNAGEWITSHIQKLPELETRYPLSLSGSTPNLATHGYSKTFFNRFTDRMSNVDVPDDPLYSASPSAQRNLSDSLGSAATSANAGNYGDAVNAMEPIVEKHYHENPGITGGLVTVAYTNTDIMSKRPEMFDMSLYSHNISDDKNVATIAPMIPGSKIHIDVSPVIRDSFNTGDQADPNIDTNYGFGILRPSNSEDNLSDHDVTHYGDHKKSKVLKLLKLFGIDPAILPIFTEFEKKFIKPLHPYNRTDENRIHNVDPIFSKKRSSVIDSLKTPTRDIIMEYEKALQIHPNTDALRVRSAWEGTGFDRVSPYLYNAYINESDRDKTAIGYYNYTRFLIHNLSDRYYTLNNCWEETPLMKLDSMMTGMSNTHYLPHMSGSFLETIALWAATDQANEVSTLGSTSEKIELKSHFYKEDELRLFQRYRYDSEIGDIRGIQGTRMCVGPIYEMYHDTILGSIIDTIYTAVAVYFNDKYGDDVDIFDENHKRTFIHHIGGLVSGAMDLMLLPTLIKEYLHTEIQFRSYNRNKVVGFPYDVTYDHSTAENIANKRFKEDIRIRMNPHYIFTKDNRDKVYEYKDRIMDQVLNNLTGTDAKHLPFTVSNTIGRNTLDIIKPSHEALGFYNELLAFVINGKLNNTPTTPAETVLLTLTGADLSFNPYRLESVNMFYNGMISGYKSANNMVTLMGFGNSDFPKNIANIYSGMSDLVEFTPVKLSYTMRDAWYRTDDQAFTRRDTDIPAGRERYSMDHFERSRWEVRNTIYSDGYKYLKFKPYKPLNLPIFDLTKFRYNMLSTMVLSAVKKISDNYIRLNQLLEKSGIDERYENSKKMVYNAAGETLFRFHDSRYDDAMDDFNRKVETNDDSIRFLDPFKELNKPVTKRHRDFDDTKITELYDKRNDVLFYETPEFKTIINGYIDAVYDGSDANYFDLNEDAVENRSQLPSSLDIILSNLEFLRLIYAGEDTEDNEVFGEDIESTFTNLRPDFLKLIKLHRKVKIRAFNAASIGLNGILSGLKFTDAGNKIFTEDTIAIIEEYNELYNTLIPRIKRALSLSEIRVFATDGVDKTALNKIRGNIENYINKVRNLKVLGKATLEEALDWSNNEWNGVEAIPFNEFMGGLNGAVGAAVESFEGHLASGRIPASLSDRTSFVHVFTTDVTDGIGYTHFDGSKWYTQYRDYNLAEIKKITDLYPDNLELAQLKNTITTAFGKLDLLNHKEFSNIRTVTVNGRKVNLLNDDVFLFPEEFDTINTAIDRVKSIIETMVPDTTDVELPELPIDGSDHRFFLSVASTKVAGMIRQNTVPVDFEGRELLGIGIWDIDAGMRAKLTPNIDLIENVYNDIPGALKNNLYKNIYSFYNTYVGISFSRTKAVPKYNTDLLVDHIRLYNEYILKGKPDDDVATYCKTLFKFIHSFMDSFNDKVNPSSVLDAKSHIATLKEIGTRLESEYSWIPYMNTFYDKYLGIWGEISTAIFTTWPKYAEVALVKYRLSTAESKLQKDIDLMSASALSSPAGQAKVQTVNTIQEIIRRWNSVTKVYEFVTKVSTNDYKSLGYATIDAIPRDVLDNHLRTLTSFVDDAERVLRTI